MASSVTNDELREKSGEENLEKNRRQRMAMEKTNTNEMRLVAADCRVPVREELGGRLCRPLAPLGSID